METHIIYCSACDRDVQVVFKMTPQPPGTAGGEVDPSGICIDYCTDRCTGSACALFDLPSPPRLEASGVAVIPGLDA